MTLTDYLQKHRLSQAQFAERLGVSQGMVWQWLAGRSRVTAERAVQIETATRKAVRARDLRPDLFGKR